MKSIAHVFGIVLAVLVLAGGTAVPATQAQAPKYPTKPIVGSPPLLSPGKFIAATNATIPPYQYVDQNGRLQGLRIELGEEIAKRMGVRMEWINVGFETHIPGLQSNRWDASITGMFYTPERARILYMLLYEYQAISISVARGNPLRITSTRDLAGRRVAVEIGGYEWRQITRINEEQTAAGLRPMEIRTFSTFADAYQALRAGQVDAVVSVDVTAKFYQDRGEFDRAVSGLAGSPATLAFKSKDLAFVVLRIMNQIKKDGFYDRLFDKYGVAKIQTELFELKGPDL
ncbi:MAG: ABC transporter substrate-binding protein [Armatimonadota bacterium]|nr:ABC transporter substrate-binding protein [Armatimonadota bacterium]MDR7548761.1 ABC transporter substrate-binding protein [Armatimonadota bacterium]